MLASSDIHNQLHSQFTPNIHPTLCPHQINQQNINYPTHNASVNNISCNTNNNHFSINNNCYNNNANIPAREHHNHTNNNLFYDNNTNITVQNATALTCDMKEQHTKQFFDDSIPTNK